MRHRTWFAAALLGVAALGLLPAQARAAGSRGTLNFQGQLTNASGQPVSGNFDMVLRVFDALVGGTQVYQEQFNDVPVEHGVYTVYLGTSAALPPAMTSPLTAATLYMEVSVQVGATFETLLPRQQIAASLFAVNATLLDGRPASAYVLQENLVTAASQTTFDRNDVRLLARPMTAVDVQGAIAETHNRTTVVRPMEFQLPLSEPGACTQARAGTMYFAAAASQVRVCTFDGTTAAWRSLGLAALGRQGNAAASCAAIKADAPASTSGPYFLKTSGGIEYETWCDFATDGGGWIMLANMKWDDVPMHGFNDTTFWLGGGTEGTAANALTSGFKSTAFSAYTGYSEVMIYMHNNGALVAYGSYSVLAQHRTTSLQGLLNSGNNITFTASRARQSGNSGAITNNQRPQNRFGDLFVDAQNSEPLLLNQTSGWNSAVTRNRIATTAGVGNTSYDHTLAGIGGYHENGAGSYITNYETAPIFAYCDSTSHYGDTRNMNAEVLCSNRGPQLARDIAIFVR